MFCVMFTQEKVVQSDLHKIKIFHFSFFDWLNYPHNYFNKSSWRRIYSEKSTHTQTAHIISRWCRDAFTVHAEILNSFTCTRVETVVSNAQLLTNPQTSLIKHQQLRIWQHWLTVTHETTGWNLRTSTGHLQKGTHTQAQTPQDTPIVCVCVELTNLVCPKALASCHYLLAADGWSLNHSLYNSELYCQMNTCSSTVVL